MRKGNVLIVDDDPMQRILLEKFTRKIGYNSVIMKDGREAFEFFQKKKTVQGISYSDVDIALFDISMPNMDGLELLKKVKPLRHNLPVIILTALKDTDLAIKAINLGAFDYIVKGEPDIFARLSTAMKNAISDRDLRKEVSLAERKADGLLQFADIIAKTKTKKIVSLLKKTANLDIPILLCGENGTGKELFAKATHGDSKRADKPFVIASCGAVPADRAESILFGHEKNFFGDGTENIGKFREANNGTIFLDGIDELPLNLQAKLLKVIQSGEVEPLGSTESFKINTRIISSTDKNLEEEIKYGKFRPELYYRLNVFCATIPPLRERKEEIPVLADRFCCSFSITENKKIEKISEKAMQILEEYDWPGNVRELRNAIFRAVLLTEDSVLDVQHFPQISQMKPIVSKISIPTDNNEFVDLKRGSKIKKLKEIESEAIEKVIRLCAGNISDASKILGVGRSTLYRKLRIDLYRQDGDDE